LRLLVDAIITRVVYDNIAKNEAFVFFFYW
jgi:hypothetical protein